MDETYPRNKIDEQASLFPLEEQDVQQREPLIGTLGDFPVHTHNKARLVAEYLRLFVKVTSHGTYVDGFAGPQNPARPETWAAKLVLDTQPGPEQPDRKQLQHFYLYEIDPAKIAMLEELRKEHSGRHVEVKAGDFNVLLDDLLASGVVTQKEATFCLIDQITFECHWATIEKLARHKEHAYKIELLYFLAQGWLDRALAGQQDESVLEKWWGNSDWSLLRKLRSFERATAVANRIRTDLGYLSVKAWPIYNAQESIMYYLVHATDHPEAPKLMNRAYVEAVRRSPPAHQFELFP